MNPMERIGKILEVVEEYKARKRTEKISAAVDRAAKSIYKQLSDPNSPERQALDRAVTAALDTAERKDGNTKPFNIKIDTDPFNIKEDK